MSKRIASIERNRGVRRLIISLVVISVILAPSVSYAQEGHSLIPAESDVPSTEITGSWTSIDDSKAYQYLDGTYAQGLKKIDGSTYYFDSEYKMATGWQKIEGAKYYFKSSGIMASGLTKIGNAKYFFTKSGKMCTGIRKIDGEKYYFSKTGKMQTGFKKINDKQYYFKTNGQMLVDTNKMIGKKLCYFDKNGVITRSIDKTKKMVALTYDDGPSANTNTILNTLKKYNGVATFFVVGNRVSSYSSSVKKAAKMGCEIGNHTYSHRFLTNISVSSIKGQINQTNRVVKKVTGSPTLIMRPPGGNHNATVRKSVGMPLIYWSIDTLDWKTQKASKTIPAVLNHVKDGDIVLMHDLYAQTASASKTIIPKLVKRGYQLVTVSELAKCRGGIKNGKVYYRFRR